MEVRLRCTGDPVTGERTISPMLAEWILIIILTTCLPLLLRFCICVFANLSNCVFWKYCMYVPTFLLMCLPILAIVFFGNIVYIQYCHMYVPTFGICVFANLSNCVFWHYCMCPPFVFVYLTSPLHRSKGYFFSF